MLRKPIDIPNYFKHELSNKIQNFSLEKSLISFKIKSVSYNIILFHCYVIKLIIDKHF